MCGGGGGGGQGVGVRGTGVVFTVIIKRREIVDHLCDQDRYYQIYITHNT